MAAQKRRKLLEHLAADHCRLVTRIAVWATHLQANKNKNADDEDSPVAWKNAFKERAASAPI